jgi:hypothetical protein
MIKDRWLIPDGCGSSTKTHVCAVESTDGSRVAWSHAGRLIALAGNKGAKFKGYLQGRSRVNLPDQAPAINNETIGMNPGPGKWDTTANTSAHA